MAMEYADDKNTLFFPPMSALSAISRTSKRFYSAMFLALFMAAFFAIPIYNVAFVRFQGFDSWLQRAHQSFCPQAEVLIPMKHGMLWNHLSADIKTDEFKSRAIDWLAGAVKIPTESYDDMGPIGKDPRWEVFDPFHGYLLEAYPLVHANLNLTKVNTYGLLYEWKGSDSSLKPILLAAHQDVVPVASASLNEWKYPPYSGHFDGERIWGRGTSDDKNGLISILSALELLLESKFQPNRSIVLAVGFDEEASGLEGAGTLAPVLLDAYGENGFAFLIDEGDGFMQQYGSIFATPGIAEKGYLDVLVEVSAPGGHSSIPPAHTSIGILSVLLVQYETHPFHVYLGRDDPLYTTLQCFAEYAEDLPSDFRAIMKKSVTSKKALDALQAFVLENPLYKSLVGTTQAIDLVHGGMKSNALPENAWAVIDHRIAVKSSISEVHTHTTGLLASLASKFNLSYVAFGIQVSEDGAPSSGNLTLSNAFYSGLEPAPITPTASDAAPYELLSGTIKATFNSYRYLTGQNNIHIAPGLISGNTDTCSYWELSRHIFRYNHQNFGDGNDMVSGMHTVNEYIETDALLEMIWFFSTLILNADESTSFN